MLVVSLRHGHPQVTPVALPIPVGGSLPLSFNFRLIPTPSSSEEVKTYALDADSSWMIQNVVGRLDIECSGSKKVPTLSTSYSL